MKRILFCILLLASLTACGGPSAPGAVGCSKKGDFCIKVTAEEPILKGKPITIKIKLKSEKDIPELQIVLLSGSPSKVLFEEPSSKEWKEREVNWKTNVKVKEEHTFTHKLLLPAENGIYQIIVQAFLPTGLIDDDSLTIYISEENGKVYYSGTSIPITQGPEPASSPGPLPTSFFEPEPTLETPAPSYP